MNFRTFDLNLLRVLDSMLALANTTRVAETIGLSQPAVSAAVARLRERLDDPLFVREGNALVPTSYALSLQAPVREALQNLEEALAGGRRFDPGECRRAFVIGASDYFNEMLMPGLAARVANEAPNVRLKMLPASIATFPAMLTADEFDMALSISVEPPDWIEKRLAFEASDLVAARNGHPQLARAGLAWGDTIPLDLFCELPHAIFSITREFVHFADEALSRIGRERRVMVSVPSYFGVARIAAQSDLLGVLPTRFALPIAQKLGLTIYRLPFAMPLTGLFLYSRRRDASNLEQAWLRGLVLDLLAPLDETRFPIAHEEIRDAEGRP